MSKEGKREAKKGRARGVKTEKEGKTRIGGGNI
jgi:hypothetical protein